MSGWSWFFKSGWAATYFRRTPEGQVFTYPWGFGRSSREYRLSDEQAKQLLTRISRAYFIGMMGFAVSVPLIVVFALATMIVMPVNSHSMGFWVAVAMCIVLPLALAIAMPYRAAASVLASVPWTSVPREPYSLTGNLQKTTAIFMILPTRVLVAMFVVFLLGLAVWAIPAYKAIASGQVNSDVLSATLQLMWSAALGTVLVMKVRAQRSAEQ